MDKGLTWQVLSVIKQFTSPSMWSKGLAPKHPHQQEALTPVWMRSKHITLLHSSWLDYWWVRRFFCLKQQTSFVSFHCCLDLGSGLSFIYILASLAASCTMHPRLHACPGYCFVLNQGLDMEQLLWLYFQVISLKAFFLTTGRSLIWYYLLFYILVTLNNSKLYTQR